MQSGKLSIGVASVGAATCAGLLFGLYQFMEWKMPNWLAVLLAVVFSAATLVFVCILILAGFAWLRRELDQWETVFRKRTADPNQWLIEIAQQDANNPLLNLHQLDIRVMQIDLGPDLERPWVEYGVTLFNSNVYPIMIGPAKGHADFKGNFFDGDLLFDPSLRPKNHVYEHRLKVYIPKRFVADVHEELAANSSIASIGLSGVLIQAQVWSDGAPSGIPAWKSPATSRPIRRD